MTLRKLSKPKVGRPSTGDFKAKVFNLEIDLIKQIQKAADFDQHALKGQGNLSMWVRSVLSKESKKALAKVKKKA